MTKNERAIPRYALFGESMGAALENLVHCETIEARSSRYSWEIAPHRHPFLYQVLLVLEGYVDLSVSDHRSQHEGPVLMLFPPGIVHGFRFSHATQGYVVTLSDQFSNALRDDPDLRRLLTSSDAIGLAPTVAARLHVLCDQMLLSGGDGAAADMLRRALAEAFLRIAAELGSDPKEEHGDELVDRFRKLVQRHLTGQPSVGFLAEQLNCTERTLSRRVRAALGMSPAQYLNERVAAEAARLLRFTNAPCCQVAEELGFADPSYFSRFFTRMTGRRPSSIRGGSTALPSVPCKLVHSL